MKRKIMVAVFGATTGGMISLVSGYQPIYNWQWWVAFIPIAATGLILAWVSEHSK